MLLIRTANTEVSICLYMLLTNIYEMTCSLVNSVSLEIRKLRVGFPSEAQKHCFSEFAIELE